MVKYLFLDIMAIFCIFPACSTMPSSKLLRSFLLKCQTNFSIGVVIFRIEILHAFNRHACNSYDQCCTSVYLKETLLLLLLILLLLYAVQIILRILWLLESKGYYYIVNGFLYSEGTKKSRQRYDCKQPNITKRVIFVCAMYYPYKEGCLIYTLL